MNHERVFIRVRLVLIGCTTTTLSVIGEKRCNAVLLMLSLSSSWISWSDSFQTSGLPCGSANVGAAQTRAFLCHINNIIVPPFHIYNDSWQIQTKKQDKYKYNYKPSVWKPFQEHNFYNYNSFSHLHNTADIFLWHYKISSAPISTVFSRMHYHCNAWIFPAW